MRSSKAAPCSAAAGRAGEGLLQLAGLVVGRLQPVVGRGGEQRQRLPAPGREAAALVGPPPRAALGRIQGLQRLAFGLVRSQGPERGEHRGLLVAAFDRLTTGRRRARLGGRGRGVGPSTELRGQRAARLAAADEPERERSRQRARAQRRAQAFTPGAQSG